MNPGKKMLSFTKRRTFLKVVGFGAASVALGNLGTRLKRWMDGAVLRAGVNGKETMVKFGFLPLLDLIDPRPPLGISQKLLGEVGKAIGQQLLALHPQVELASAAAILVTGYHRDGLIGPSPVMVGGVFGFASPVEAHVPDGYAVFGVESNGNLTYLKPGMEVALVPIDFVDRESAFCWMDTEGVYHPLFVERNGRENFVRPSIVSKDEYALPVGESMKENVADDDTTWPHRPRPISGLVEQKGGNYYALAIDGREVKKEWEWQAVKPGEWGLLRDENGVDLLTMESEQAAEKLRDDMIKAVLSFNTHYVAKAREKGVTGYGDTEAAKWLKQADWDPDRALELWMAYAKEAQTKGEKIKMNLPERAMDRLIKSEGIDGMPPLRGVKLSNDAYDIDLSVVDLSILPMDVASKIFPKLRFGEVSADPTIIPFGADSDNKVAFATRIHIAENGRLRIVIYNQDILRSSSLVQVGSLEDIKSLGNKQLEEKVNDMVQYLAVAISIGEIANNSKVTLSSGDSALIVYPASEVYKLDLLGGDVGLVVNR